MSYNTGYDYQDNPPVSTHNSPVMGNPYQTAPDRYDGNPEESQFSEVEDPERLRDPCCAVTFVIQAAALAIAGFIFLVNKQLEFELNGDSQAIIMFALMSGIVGIFLAFSWMKVLRSCTGGIIKFTIIIQGLMYLAGAVISIAAGQVWGAFVGLGFCALMALYYYCMRGRIAFTEKVMEPSIEAVNHYHGIFGVALGTTLASIVYSVLWIVTVGVIQAAASDDDVNDDTRGAVWFLMVLPLLWTTETFKNISFTTAAGAVGSWWLTRDTFSSYASFQRASTKSLGSIALGSLLVAVVAFINMLIRSLRREARDEGLAVQIAVACLACIGEMIEHVMRLFNKYAFVQVGLYGKPYIQAGRDAFDLFHARGFDLIINDDLSGMAVGMGVLICGLVNMFVIGVPAAYHFSGSESAGSSTGVVMATALFMGIFTAQAVLAQVSAAVATTFVLWAQEPDALAQSRPHEYSAIQDARAKMYE